MTFQHLLQTGMACATLVIGSSLATAQTTTLYDGSSNVLPGAPNWLYLTDPFVGASSVQGVGGGVTTLDTTPADGEKAGYFGTFAPGLDQNTGYSVHWTARVIEETHDNNNRAGLSFIILSSDSKGVEIAFWEDEIWTQTDTPLFNHGEGVAYDTTASLTDYRLDVAGNQYELFANDVPILDGQLRDYSSFGFPYNGSNFLFFGDDTSSAEANFELSHFAVTVPEPSIAATTAVLAVLAQMRLWRR